MRLYVSGGPILDKFSRRETELIHCRLFSTHDVYLKNVLRWVGMIKDYDRYPRHIMLDSGAFTGWNKGLHVTVDECKAAYDAFFEAVEQHNVKFDSVVMISLDVIPGSKGRSASRTEIEEATRQSDINTAILQKTYGDKILPVFHQDESQERLLQVAGQAEYICLSPRNDVAESRRTEWAMWAHSLVPNNRTHGLATTGISMTYDSPWFSVDSASWVHLAIYGKIYMDLGDRYRMINISEKSSYLYKKGEHYNTITAAEKEFVEMTLKECGFTLEEAQTHFRPRALTNIYIMEKQAERARAKLLRKPAQGRLFG